MEGGGWRLANHPPAEIQASLANHLCKSPQPLFSERGAFFSARFARSKRRIYFLQKKTTVFSLFLKREGEAGIKKIGCG